MKIMWITAMGISDSIMQGINSNINSSGGWIEATLLLLIKNNNVRETVIVSIRPSHDNGCRKGEKITLYKTQGKVCGLTLQKSLYWSLKAIIQHEKPDIIDIQGIEFDFSTLVSRMDEVSCPILYTIQGMSSEMISAYGNTPDTQKLLYKRSLRDNVTMHGSLEHALLLWLRGNREKELLGKINYVTGRTEWDKKIVQSNNSQIEYYSVNRILRPEFYSDEKWVIEHIQKHTLFVPQISSILKGGHILIKIIVKLVCKYPDLEVWIPGDNIAEKKPQNQSGYEKSIMKQIKRYGLEKNIIFVGEINASQIISYLKRANAFLQVSLIENSSNALAEAQILGVPCVASNVGGTSSYITDGDTGILYNIKNTEEAAKAVESIFEDRDVANKLSAKGRAQAQIRHDRTRNSNELIEVYKKIITKG